MNTFRNHIIISITGLLFGFVLFAQSPLPENTKISKIAEGFTFTEGPVWKEGTGLLFSDIPANSVYKWNPDKGVEEFLKPSGNSNGLAVDSLGNLILAQHGKRRVAKLIDGDEIVLAEKYNNQKLNSPNDLTIKSNGTIFFTDPPYGISKDREELGFYGIYSIDRAGKLHLLDKSL